MTMIDVVRDFLAADDWPVTESRDLPIIRTGYEGTTGRWDLFLHAREAEEQVVCYSVCSANVAPARRVAMAELITRINSGIVIGNFELDFNDGEVRYKTGIDIEPDALTQSLVGRLVYGNVLMMDRYLPALMTLIYSQAAPVDILSEFETTDEEAAPSEA